LSFNCKHTGEVLISYHVYCRLKCQDFSFMVALDNKSHATIVLGNDCQWFGGAAAYPFQVFSACTKQYQMTSDHAKSMHSTYTISRNSLASDQNLEVSSMGT
jgi:hypothetical protein